MTTSALLTKTAANIIEEALRSGRIIPAEQTVTATDYANGLVALNEVVKNWQTDGVYLFAQERAVLPLIKDQKSYTLSASGDKCGYEDTFYNTTLSSGASSGATTLTVASSANAAASQSIGIELDDGTRQWTTVSSVPSSTSIVISAALTSAAASGNTVFYFTDQIVKPIRLENVMYASSITSSEIPVTIWSRQEYMDQTDKDARGTVVNWYYQPRQSDGLLYVWQVANSVKNVLRFDVYKPLDSYGATGDTITLSEEFFRPLRWAVAAELGPEYGVKTDRQTVLEQKAAVYLEDALDNDVGTASVLFSPDFD